MRQRPSDRRADSSRAPAIRPEQAGVTLLELLIVLSIMAIIAALVLPLVRQWRESRLAAALREVAA